MTAKSDKTHLIIPHVLVLTKRTDSSYWQCRIKIDGQWQRLSTKEANYKAAVEKASELMVEAKIRKKNNLPAVTRRFSNVAKLAIDRLEKEIQSGRGKVSYKGYIQIIEDYLIPILGNLGVHNITQEALDKLDEERVELMGKEPSESTRRTHYIALNRVFDEAIERGFMTVSSRPKLDLKQDKKTRRAAFSDDEVARLIVGLDSYPKKTKSAKLKEYREILRDYVDFLLDTGARPGKEVLNLKWSQIRCFSDMYEKDVQTGELKPYQPTKTYSSGEEYEQSPEYGSEEEEARVIVINHRAEMHVSGKTGPRFIIGNNRAVRALMRIARRNYGRGPSIASPLEVIVGANSEDYVFRSSDKAQPANLDKMFIEYLKQSGLLIDPVTGQKRVLYSLRHTYATRALTHDQIPIYTLSQQMGTSVAMIERHYSHLSVFNARHQLTNMESRQALEQRTSFYSAEEYKKEQMEKNTI